MAIKVDLGGTYILTDLHTPQDSEDAVNKGYVDMAIDALDLGYKGSVGYGLDTDGGILTVDTDLIADTEWVKVYVAEHINDSENIREGYGIDINRGGDNITIAVDTEIIADTEWVKDYIHTHGMDTDSLSYFKVNSTLGPSKAIGGDAIAIGPNTVANGGSSISIAHGGGAYGNNSIFIGSQDSVGGGVDPDALRSIAFGYGALVSGNARDAMAIGSGTDVYSGHSYSIAFGHGAQATKANELVIGAPTQAESIQHIMTPHFKPSGEHPQFVRIDTDGNWELNDGGITYLDVNGTGTAANATGTQTIALGPGGTTAEGNSSLAIGHNAQATGAQGIAIGENTESANTGAIAIGEDARAHGFQSIHIGTGDNNMIESDSLRAIALGHDSQIDSDAEYSIAIGATAHVNEGHDHSIVLGRGASTTQANELVIGHTISGLGIEHIRSPQFTGGDNQFIAVDSSGNWTTEEVIAGYVGRIGYGLDTDDGNLNVDTDVLTTFVRDNDNVFVTSTGSLVQIQHQFKNAANPNNVWYLETLNGTVVYDVDPVTQRVSIDVDTEVIADTEWVKQHTQSSGHGFHNYFPDSDYVMRRPATHVSGNNVFASDGTDIVWFGSSQSAFDTDVGAGETIRVTRRDTSDPFSEDDVGFYTVTNFTYNSLDDIYTIDLSFVSGDNSLADQPNDSDSDSQYFIYISEQGLGSVPFDGYHSGYVRAPSHRRDYEYLNGTGNFTEPKTWLKSDDETAAIANGDKAVALGGGAIAAADNSTAIGYGAQISNDAHENSIVIGSGASGDSDQLTIHGIKRVYTPDWSGDSTQVIRVDSDGHWVLADDGNAYIAINADGNDAVAKGTNSISIGANATDSEPATPVSFRISGSAVPFFSTFIYPINQVTVNGADASGTNSYSIPAGPTTVMIGGVARTVTFIGGANVLNATSGINVTVSDGDLNVGNVVSFSGAGDVFNNSITFRGQAEKDSELAIFGIQSVYTPSFTGGDNQVIYVDSEGNWTTADAGEEYIRINGNGLTPIAGGTNAIAIGDDSSGTATSAAALDSIAIGTGARVADSSHVDSIAIGKDAVTDTEQQLVINRIAEVKTPLFVAPEGQFLTTDTDGNWEWEAAGGSHRSVYVEADNGDTSPLVYLKHDTDNTVEVHTVDSEFAGEANGTNISEASIQTTGELTLVIQGSTTAPYPLDTDGTVYYCVTDTYTAYFSGSPDNEGAGGNETFFEFDNPTIIGNSSDNRTKSFANHTLLSVHSGKLGFTLADTDWIKDAYTGGDGINIDSAQEIEVDDGFGLNFDSSRQLQVDVSQIATHDYVNGVVRNATRGEIGEKTDEHTLYLADEEHDQLRFENNHSISGNRSYIVNTRGDTVYQGIAARDDDLFVVQGTDGGTETVLANSSRNWEAVQYGVYEGNRWDDSDAFTYNSQAFQYTGDAPTSIWNTDEGTFSNVTFYRNGHNNSSRYQITGRVQLGVVDDLSHVRTHDDFHLIAQSEEFSIELTSGEQQVTISSLRLPGVDSDNGVAINPLQYVAVRWAIHIDHYDDTGVTLTDAPYVVWSGTGSAQRHHAGRADVRTVTYEAYLDPADGQFKYGNNTRTPELVRTVIDTDGYITNDASPFFKVGGNGATSNPAVVTASNTGAIAIGEGATVESHNDAIALGRGAVVDKFHQMRISRITEILMDTDYGSDSDYSLATKKYVDDNAGQIPGNGQLRNENGIKLDANGTDVSFFSADSMINVNIEVDTDVIADTEWVKEQIDGHVDTEAVIQILADEYGIQMAPINFRSTSATPDYYSALNNVIDLNTHYVIGLPLTETTVPDGIGGNEYVGGTLIVQQISNSDPNVVTATGYYVFQTGFTQGTNLSLQFESDHFSGTDVVGNTNGVGRFRVFVSKTPNATDFSDNTFFNKAGDFVNIADQLAGDGLVSNGTSLSLPHVKIQTTDDTDPAVAGGIDAISIGAGANASQQDSIAIGHGANSIHTSSIALGMDAQTTTSNQLVIGSDTESESITSIRSPHFAPETGTRLLAVDSEGTWSFSSPSGSLITSNDFIGVGCNIEDSDSKVKITTTTIASGYGISTATNSMLSYVTDLSIDTDVFPDSDWVQGYAVRRVNATVTGNELRLQLQAEDATSIGSSEKLIGFESNVTLHGADRNVAIDSDTTFIAGDNITIEDSDDGSGYNKIKITSTAGGGGPTYTAGYGINTTDFASNTIAVDSDSLPFIKDDLIKLGPNTSTSATSATGNDSFAFGGGATTGTAIRSFAIGGSSQVTGGQNGVAIGYESVAASNSIAIGRASADTEFSTAIGWNAGTYGGTPMGYRATCIGAYTRGGANAVAIGVAAQADGDNSFAMGRFANSDGSHSISIGRASEAEGAYAIAVGAGFNGDTDDAAKAHGNNSIALGRDTFADHSDSVAIGRGAQTTAAEQISFHGGMATHLKLPVVTGFANRTALVNALGSDDIGAVILYRLDTSTAPQLQIWDGNNFN